MNQATDPDDLGSNDNPFGNDMKGEFGGAGGTSHIFRSTSGGQRTKVLLVILALVLLGAGASYYMSLHPDEKEDFLVNEDSESEGEDISADSSTEEHKKDLEKKKSPDHETGSELEAAKTPSRSKASVEGMDSPEDLSKNSFASEMNHEAHLENSTPRETSQGEMVSGGPVLEVPENGAMIHYDESSVRPVFQWKGAKNGEVLFSKTSDMKVIDHKVRVKGRSIAAPRLLPGLWYWQVKTASGASPIHSLEVKSPVRRNIKLAAPREGAALSGSGGVVTWSGDQKVSYYRVELSEDQNWAKPTHRFATSGTQLQIKDVKQGPYQLRLGAFSEVSGKWEYTPPLGITIQ